MKTLEVIIVIFFQLLLVSSVTRGASQTPALRNQKKVVTTLESSLEVQFGSISKGGPSNTYALHRITSEAVSPVFSSHQS